MHVPHWPNARYFVWHKAFSTLKLLGFAAQHSRWKMGGVHMNSGGAQFPIRRNSVVAFLWLHYSFSYLIHKRLLLSTRFSRLLKKAAPESWRSPAKFWLRLALRSKKPYLRDKAWSPKPWLHNGCNVQVHCKQVWIFKPQIWKSKRVSFASDTFWEGPDSDRYEALM